MGFLLAFATALSVSMRDLLGRHTVRSSQAVLAAWCAAFLSLPILGVWLIASERIDLRLGFWLAFIVGGGLNALAQHLYYRALSISELSLSVPFLALTPAFMMITAPLILGETITGTEKLGIILIVIGAYVLNLAESKLGLFAPIKAIYTNLGSRLMLLVAFVWSVSANFDKIGVNNSGPITWAFAVNLMACLALFPASGVWRPSNYLEIKKNISGYCFLALANSAVYIFHMYALLFVPVVYLIPIKRTSILWSVLLGCVVFKERNIRERLGGAIIMLSGVVLICLSG